MDLGQLQDEQKIEVKHAKIRAIGQNHHKFGTDEAGEMIGKTVEVHHVLPHTDRMISHPDHCHAIIKHEWAEKTSFELDLKLEFEGG